MGHGGVRDRHAETGTRPVSGGGVSSLQRRGSTRGNERAFYFAKRARLTNRTKPPSRARAHTQIPMNTQTQTRQTSPLAHHPLSSPLLLSFSPVLSSTRLPVSTFIIAIKRRSVIRENPLWTASGTVIFLTITAPGMNRRHPAVPSPPR